MFFVRDRKTKNTAQGFVYIQKKRARLENQFLLFSCVVVSYVLLEFIQNIATFVSR